MPTSHYLMQSIVIVGITLLLPLAAFCSVRKARQSAQERAAILEKAKNKQLVADLQRQARRAEQARQEEIREALHFRASSLPPRRHALPKGRRLPI